MRRALLSLAAAATLVVACSGADATSDGSEEADVATSGVQVLFDKCPNDPPNFHEPTKAEEEAAVAAHRNVDPDKVVPKDLLATALGFLDVNKERLPNQRSMVVVDFSKPSSDKRFFLINLESGAVEPHQVAHGSGSNPGHTGLATKFSNTKDSNMSSLGFYRGLSSYEGKHGKSLQLSGLSTTNDQACERSIVLHAADYVHDNGKTTGSSWGCFALPPNVSSGVVDRLKDGGLIYAGRSGH